MSYTDVITRIKNAQAAGKSYLRVPYSRIDSEVIRLLEKEKFIKKAEIKGRSPQKVVKVYLRQNKPIKGAQFLSRPSLKQYRGYRDIKGVKGGHGILVVSTPKGIMTGEDAKKNKVGGQLLFKIW